jgi:hypothetical protein
LPQTDGEKAQFDLMRIDGSQSISTRKFGPCMWTSLELTTPDALRAYLDLKLNPDARMSDYSYEWTARLLKKLGFENLAQIDECISDYDHDVVSRAVAGGRQGQLSRFEHMLLARMGEGFILGHTWAAEEWFNATKQVELEKLRRAGIMVGSFNPASHLTNSVSEVS